MSSPMIEVQYQKAIATLKKRPDFKHIELKQVRIWATGYTIFHDSVTKGIAMDAPLLQVVEMVNTMSETLQLPKIIIEDKRKDLGKA